MQQFWWYVARSGGIVSWALLAASVLWGLALSTKVFGKKPRPNWLLDMHQWLGMLTMIFIGVHVVGLVADSYTHFGISEVLVPFASDWHPAAVAWGVVAMYLLLAVEITSLCRKWMPKKVWRSVHYLSFPLFVSATIHGVTAGTDATTTMAIATVVVVVALVAMLSFVRLDLAARQARLDAEAAANGTARPRVPIRPAPVPPRAPVHPQAPVYSQAPPAPVHPQAPVYLPPPPPAPPAARPACSRPRSAGTAQPVRQV